MVMAMTLFPFMMVMETHFASSTDTQHNDVKLHCQLEHGCKVKKMI
jgi:hypothetical protein